MAKNKRKKSKKATGEYVVGYCKPPREHQWQKGCASPNPNGRPKKITSLKEALQISLSKEVNAKDMHGGVKKITCLEALASKTVVDAIAKDGPTRRMLYRGDLLHLPAKDQEYEASPEEKKIEETEQKYGELLHQWAEMNPKTRDVLSKMIADAIRSAMRD